MNLIKRMLRGRGNSLSGIGRDVVNFMFYYLQNNVDCLRLDDISQVLNSTLPYSSLIWTYLQGVPKKEDKRSR